jgi:hypothetical protein
VDSAGSGSFSDTLCGQRALPDRGDNAFFEFIGQLFERVPGQVIHVTRVKVRRLDLVLVAREDHRDSQAACETSFVVHAGAMAGEVRDDELASPDSADDLVHDVVVELLEVDPQRRVPGVVDPGFKAAEEGAGAELLRRPPAIIADG